MLIKPVLYLHKIILFIPLCGNDILMYRYIVPNGRIIQVYEYLDMYVNNIPVFYKISHTLLSIWIP